MKQQTASKSEWVVAALSVLLILVAFGVLLHHALTESGRPPDIRIDVIDVARTGTGYVVEIAIRNVGETTAADLTVEGKLLQDTVAIETSTLTIPYVPEQAVREAGLFFRNNPRSHKLEIRPMGYDRP